jgi:hypothetical protein
MIAYHALEFENVPIRAHPWDFALVDPSQRYVDFKAEPHLIRAAIEDLILYKRHAFAKKLYSLIETLNGPKSRFETNDCGFQGPGPNNDKQFPFDVRSSGRLMILFRRIIDNTDDDKIDRLKDRLIGEVTKIDPQFRSGAVGISRSPTGYFGLSENPKLAAVGKQIRIDMFAYADSDGVCLYNMKKVVGVVGQALSIIDRDNQLK